MKFSLKNSGFKNKLKTMLNVDFRRMFTSPFLYIMLAISFVIPILILVMTSMMDGTVSIDPQTGKGTVIEGFKNVWEIIGTAGGDNQTMSMGLTTMCNINMMFFFIAVFVCVFISDDFRSGYVKNLFTVRSKKSDYIVSKFISGFLAGASMLILFFIGAMIGGKIANVSFELGNATIGGILFSMISKIFLVSIFVSIYILACVFAKQKLWLSIILSLGIGMLFFTMVPIITPLNSTIINVILCLVGGGLFSFGICYAGNIILRKTSIL